jgi:hypothetical protein
MVERGCTLKEMGDRLGVSGERARQLLESKQNAKRRAVWRKRWIAEKIKQQFSLGDLWVLYSFKERLADTRLKFRWVEVHHRGLRVYPFVNNWRIDIHRTARIWRPGKQKASYYSFHITHTDRVHLCIIPKASWCLAWLPPQKRGHIYVPVHSPKKTDSAKYEFPIRRKHEI